MPIPKKILLYRIIHIDNLDYILDIGKLTCPTHPEKDPNYIGIGDESLIENRNQKVIPLQPGGTFLDYVSFYFGRRSPMLFSIWKGNDRVRRIPQSEIIYLVSTFDRIKESNKEYVYFDGHGYHHLSGCYKDDSGLNEIDWGVVNSQKWFDSETDTDRKRRKQAELLVYKELPLDYLIGIGVYNIASEQKVLQRLSEKSVKLNCKIKEVWYY
jgi:hypothetical protein